MIEYGNTPFLQGGRTLVPGTINILAHILELLYGVRYTNLNTNTEDSSEQRHNWCLQNGKLRSANTN